MWPAGDFEKVDAESCTFKDLMEELSLSGWRIRAETLDPVKKHHYVLLAREQRAATGAKPDKP
jgi:hypothetical protein